MRVLPIALGLGFRVLSIRLRPGQRLVSMPFILRFLPRLALSVLLYLAQGYHLLDVPAQNRRRVNVGLYALYSDGLGDNLPARA